MRPGYKQTEVGVIPEEWEVKPLSRLAEIRGGIAKNSNIENSDPITVHYLRVANVQDGFLDLSEMSKIQLSRNDLSRYKVLPGDVLMNEGGDLDKLGRGAIWHGEFDPCVHQNHVFVVRCKSALLPEYLNFWTSTLPVRRFFLFAGKQTTNLASISKSSLGELPVAAPQVDEQRAIAEALSDMDALLGALDRLIGKKRDLKQAAMQQLLTGQTRLPGFHGEWEVKRLDELADIRSGGTPSTTEPRSWDGDIPWCTPTDITALNGKKYLSETSRTITEHGLKASSAEMIPAYSVVMTSRATLGECAINTVPVSTNQGFKNFVPFATTDAAFLYYLLTTQKKGFISLCGGSTFLEIGKSQLVAYQIRLPASKDEQIAIANVLSDIDTELIALEQRRDKTRALKQGMMQQLLTGQIRLVPTSVAGVPISQTDAAKSENKKPAHSWAFNEAVVIAVLTEEFGTSEFPLGRLRYTKLAYLLHRYVEHEAKGYLKKAAGPYNPTTRYAGPEKIAQQSGYIKAHRHGTFAGFVAAEKIAQAREYFLTWYGQGVLDWLQQFRFHKNDELELLATVDMAMEDLRRTQKAVSPDAVKQIIHDHPEWEAKLQREVFFDDNLGRAIQICRELFA